MLWKQESQIYLYRQLGSCHVRTETYFCISTVYIYDDGAGAPEGATEEEEDKFDQDAYSGLQSQVCMCILIDASSISIVVLSGLISDRMPVQIGNFAAIGTFDPQIEILTLRLHWQGISWHDFGRTGS